MDMLGVRRKQKRNDDVLKKKKKKEKNIKVTYISSPMKVKTSASNFRALVQQLTGQDSNVEEKFLQQESAVHDHDDEIENIDLAAMAGSSSNISDDQRHDEVEEIEGSSPSSWLDLLTEDYCSGFQYSRPLFEPFNQQQQYMKFDLVEI
ncbi:hypothetical protein K1719_013546 [Acacia pycnantha]|nr:hypothetical protein K1719_013546 [Acacia pycnantha]